MATESILKEGSLSLTNIKLVWGERSGGGGRRRRCQFFVCSTYTRTYIVVAAMEIANDGGQPQRLRRRQ